MNNQGDEMVKALLLSILMNGAGLNTSIGVAREADIINAVANEYKLTDSGRKLLFAIRRVEDGAAGHEFGVGSDDPTHPAHRFRDRPEQSVRIQAEWAAGTVSRRWTGDVDRFAARWCPKNAESWARNVAFYMRMAK
jgi:hypothetical protein